MVNGMMLNFAIRDYSKDTVNDIVEALKIDGYLTSDYELKSANKIKMKR